MIQQEECRQVMQTFLCRLGVRPSVVNARGSSRGITLLFHTQYRRVKPFHHLSPITVQKKKKKSIILLKILELHLLLHHQEMLKCSMIVQICVTSNVELLHRKCHIFHYFGSFSVFVHWWLQVPTSHLCKLSIGPGLALDCKVWALILDL